MCCAAETSAATASQPSTHHHWHSANAPDRRTNNCATAANRCAIAVDSSRVASPITSMGSTSDTPSHMRSSIAGPTDTTTRLSTGVGPAPYHSPVSLRLYLGAGVVSGIAAYLLGASAMWSVAIGAVAPAVLAAVPHFLRGAFVGLSTRDDVTAAMSGTE